MIGEIESWRMEKDHKISEHKRRKKIDRRLVKEEERERKLKLERYTIVSTRASVLSVTGKGLGFLR